MKRTFAAAAVVAVVVINGCSDGQAVGSGAAASPSRAPTPTTGPASAPPSASAAASAAEVPLRDGPLQDGTYVTAPFIQPGSDACFVPPQPGCIDATNDDSIRVTFTVPDGWAGIGPDGIWLASVGSEPPGGAGASFSRGASLYSDPCRAAGTPEIPVGPTVADFVDAISDHPLLDATPPVDVTLAGYSGKYLDIQVPADPTIQGSSEPASLAGCPIYRPWEPGVFAQGPSHRWHLWILDVEGVRVVVETMDYAATSVQHRAELQAIVDSVRITP